MLTFFALISEDTSQLTMKQKLFLSVYNLIKNGMVRPFSLEDLDTLDVEYLPFVIEYQKTVDYVTESESRMHSQQAGVK